MKAVPLERAGESDEVRFVVEIEEGDVTGCPPWCDESHVGERLWPGERLAHTREVQFNHSTVGKKANGREAAVQIWEQASALSLSVLDDDGMELLEGLTPIGAYNLSVALREAALRAQPFIQTYDDDLAANAYKAPDLRWNPTAPAPRVAETPKPKAVKAA